MRLILLRHGDAVDRANSDFERVLTDKGREQAAVVGAFYNKLSLGITHIISSPYLRAKETAEIVSGQIAGAPEIELDDALGCGMDYNGAFSILRPLADDAVVLMVGHQPDFGALCGYLCGTHSGANFEFKKACSAFFDLYRFNQGGAVLEMFVPVKSLKSM